jgi:tRNA-dihydrouridine synthase 3
MDEAARQKMFQGQLILAPMTKGSNLPFRRLCVEQGSRFAVGEMALSRRVTRQASGEMALLRRHADETIFGVQLCGRYPDIMARAAEIAQERGADFVDVNLGCPIDSVVRHGEGAALMTRPRRLEQILQAMRRVLKVGLTVKLRSGWSEDKPLAVSLARVAEGAGADAVALHARSRTQRYRRPADWNLIAEVAAAVNIPVIGNGDIIHGTEAAQRMRETGCASVMTARGALVKPWLFREAKEGREIHPGGSERMDLLRRYVTLALEHFGDDEHGREKVRYFLDWHLDFFCRWVPPRDGAPPFQLQERHPGFEPGDDDEALLVRPDLEGRRYLVRLLVDGPEAAGPPPGLPSPDAPLAGRDHKREITG